MEQSLVGMVTSSTVFVVYGDTKKVHVLQPAVTTMREVSCL